MRKRSSRLWDSCTRELGLETKLEKLRSDERKDDVITFEQLGVDRLFVDESHFYKNRAKRCA